MWAGKYGVTLPRIRGEGEVTTELFEIYEQETAVRFSVASDENGCTRKTEIFLSPDAQLVFATELAEGKDPLGIAEKTLERVQRLRRGGTGGPVFDRVEYRGREEVPRAGHGRTWSIPTWAYRLLYKDDETARKVRLWSQVIEKFPLGEEGGHELFTQCWESRKDTDFEWWARVGEFIKPLFSGQPGDVDRDLIRRCAQEGVRGISDLEIANLALAASEEKKLRDSWWTVTSEESEGEGADEDSSEEKEGTEEEKSSGNNRDSEGLRRISRGERESLVAFTRRFKCLSQTLVDRGMLSEVDRCVIFMLHLPEEKRKEVLEKAPRDSANFEKVAEVVFTGGGVDVREYMKETLDMALRNMRGIRNDGPRGSDRPPPAPPGPRWGDRPAGRRNESSGQGGWRNDREIGGNRGSDWGTSHWKDARDGRWGDAPQARAPGPRPEFRAPPPPSPPPPAPPAPIAATAQRGPLPNNPQARAGCVYCNEENHIRRDCPYLTEALRLGVVKLNENKWVVWGDSGEVVSFYPSMKVNVDKRVALQEARLGKKPEVGGSSSAAHIEMVESPGGLSIREPQVSSIKFIDTQAEEERLCLRVRTQVGAETSENQASVTESTEVKSGDSDQPMTDAKAVEEKKEKPTSPKSPKKRGPKKFEMKCTLDEIDTVAPLRQTLMEPMQCTILEYLATSKSAREELLSIIRKVRVPLAVAPTVLVEGPAKEEVQATRITMEELPVNFFSGEEAKKFYVLGSGQLQAVVSGKKMRALVDNGSESTVCRDSIARELGLEIDRGVSMSMVVADNKLQPAEGVCYSPVIEVAGVEATVLIFSVKECSSELILGRTWLSAVHATTVYLPDGSQTLSIQSLDGIRVVLKTVDAQDERNRTSLTRRKGAQSRVYQVRLEEVPLTGRGPKGDQLETEDVGDRIVINGMGYEKEDEGEEFGGRDRTGEATISEEEIGDIIRKRKETERQRITADRLTKMDIGDENITEKEKEFIAMT
ncbi:hypothetical protein CBR_g30463 [Chara braunii]|uniref:CCHC-type domain-containing protein n=1 Tax=Chara braunii TaxID=69332 RepID=A0A388LCT0_CHABU|nr:hypothetical protein CBR_g30463 [Chara braunii]|eukprot:GBG80096.1 hypothetical protein CBR_g30463 [Chara braunii]